MTLFQLAIQAGPISKVTTEIFVVSFVTLGAIVPFVTEWLPIGATAITIVVMPIVLEPRADISPAEGISGFSSSAAITVLAMLILNAGINRTGIVQIVGWKISLLAGKSPNKQLLVTIGVTGPVSGFINNTPVIVILVLVISNVAHKGKTSPSRLLIPLSYTF